MVLHRIKDFDPNYREHFDNDDVVGLDLYSGEDKVGSIDDVLVDDEGQFRYLVINTGIWVFGKKVLLPIGSARIDYGNRCVFAKNLTKAQVEQLPKFDQDTVVDYQYEEQVRGVYRPLSTTEMSATTIAPDYDQQSYNYEYDSHLYDLNDADHQSLKLYQERLIANKIRRKAGEVTIGKHIETEIAQVSVPVEKERVVIERTPMDSEVVALDEAAFQEGEVTRLEVYEETPEIRKEAFVREEVRVQKVIDQDVVTAEEQVRREELDIDIEGNPVIDRAL